MLNLINHELKCQTNCLPVTISLRKNRKFKMYVLIFNQFIQLKIHVINCLGCPVIK